MKTTTIAAIVMLGTAPALADTLTEIAQFSDAICRDIPEGKLTKTTVQGKVEANAGLLAKILSGDANISGSRADEIYKGIPIEKLPDNIPTVTMCKLDLAKILISKILEIAPRPYCASNTAAEIGAQWVLNRDAGARRRYDAARVQGATRYNALMQAQSHKEGAGARAAFVDWGADCVDWFARQNGG